MRNSKESLCGEILSCQKYCYPLNERIVPTTVFSHILQEEGKEEEISSLFRDDGGRITRPEIVNNTRWPDHAKYTAEAVL